MGAAERQTHTFSGRLAVLNNLWGEFKEQLGFALIGSEGAANAMDTLLAAVRALIEWVTRNKDALRAMVSEGVDLAFNATLLLAQALAAATAGFGAMLVSVGLLTGNTGMLAAGARIEAFTARVVDQTAALRGLWEQMSRRPDWATKTGIRMAPELELGPGGAPVVSRGARDPEGDARRAAAREARAREARQQQETDESIRTKARAASEAAIASSWTEAEQRAESEQWARDQVEAQRQAAIESSWAEAEQRAESERWVHDQIAELQGQELAEQAEKARLIGDMIGAAMGSGIRPFAAGKARQNLIEAAELAVRAITAAINPFTAAQAPVYAIAAAKHLAIAGAWRALAGGGGGGGGSGGAFGGGGVAASREASGAAAGRAVPQNEVSIYLIGPGFSALQPEVQRVVWGATQEAQERYGENARLTVRRGR